jgi:Alanine dehydrogenase
MIREKGAYIPHELLEELRRANSCLTIGLPKERDPEERRLSLTPEAVAMLVDAGHRVLVETNAGLGINYGNTHFSEAGAEIVDTQEEVYQADYVFKILPPSPSEVALMKSGSTLFSMVQLNLFDPAAFEGLMLKRMNAFSYELMTDESGRSPILNIMSEIEGATSIMVASEMMSNVRGGKGILLGGIPGVPPTEVIIIGAGNAGAVAARAALSLGAIVKVFDDDVNKLRRIQQVLGRNIYTSNFHLNVLRSAFASADVVIGAMRYINSRRRYVISEDLIKLMKRGSLVIDLRINQGGCFETTCCLSPTEYNVFERYGVFHYCKPNISNYVARTTSTAFSNILTPMLFLLSDMGTIQTAVKADDCFRSGIYMYRGKPVNNYVSNHFNLLSNDLDIYVSAF